MDPRRAPCLFTCRTAPHAAQAEHANSSNQAPAATNGGKGHHAVRRHSICAAPTVKWPVSIEGYLELLAAQRAPGGYFRDNDSFARDREWHDTSSAVPGIMPSHVLLNPRTLHSCLPSSGSSVGDGSARSRGSSGGSADRSAVASATGVESLLLVDPGQRQRASWEDELDSVVDAAQQQGRGAGDGLEAAAAGEDIGPQAEAGAAAAGQKVGHQGGRSPYSVLSPPSSPTTSSSAHASLDEADAAPEVEDEEAPAAAVSVTTPLLSLEERRARAMAEAGLPSEQERAAHSSMRFRGLRTGASNPTSLDHPSTLASTDSSLSSHGAGSSDGGVTAPPASTRRPSASIRLPPLVPPPASVPASEGPGARMVSLPLAPGSRGWDSGHDWDSEWE